MKKEYVIPSIDPLLFIEDLCAGEGLLDTGSPGVEGEGNSWAPSRRLYI